MRLLLNMKQLLAILLALTACDFEPPEPGTVAPVPVAPAPPDCLVCVGRLTSSGTPESIDAIQCPGETDGTHCVYLGCSLACVDECVRPSICDEG